MLGRNAQGANRNLREGAARIELAESVASTRSHRAPL